MKRIWVLSVEEEITETICPRKVVRTKTEVLNVIRCDGAVCISINNNYKKYYSNGVSGRNLNIKKYKYEVS